MSPTASRSREAEGRRELARTVQRLSAFTTALAACVTFFQHLRTMFRALSAGADQESQSVLAGRLAEHQVAGTYGRVSGVEVYQALRIPDTGHRGRREIDAVLLSKRECYLLEVKNWSGTITIHDDGSWLQTRRDGSTQRCPNVVEETKHKTALLEDYIRRRGISLPPDFIQAKVVLVNRNCRPEQAIIMQPEVLVAENWERLLKQESAGGILGWLRSIFPERKSDKLDEPTLKKLHAILSTAPTWDKLELEGGRIMHGDFIRFRGRSEDEEAVKRVKRSTVCSLTMVHRRGLLANFLGLLVGSPNRVRVTATSRDYTGEATTLFGRKIKQQETFEYVVCPDLQIVFQPAGKARPENVKIDCVNNMSLST